MYQQQWVMVNGQKKHCHVPAVQVFITRRTHARQLFDHQWANPQPPANMMIRRNTNDIVSPPRRKRRFKRTPLISSPLHHANTGRPHLPEMLIAVGVDLPGAALGDPPIPTIATTRGPSQSQECRLVPDPLLEL